MYVTSATFRPHTNSDPISTNPNPKHNRNPKHDLINSPPHPNHDRAPRAGSYKATKAVSLA